MEIEIVKISSLNPDPNNARVHDEKNLKAIESSLAQFGQRKPIVLTRSSLVVAGNGTTEAAKRLGWEEIAAVRVPDSWSEDQVKAFALADNRTAELATWSPEVLASQLVELEEANFVIEDFGFVKVNPAELPEDLFSDSEAPRLDERTPITCPNCKSDIRKTAKGYEVV
jgi:ParB-like chromosome segregation protein Spo0J